MLSRDKINLGLQIPSIRPEKEGFPKIYLGYNHGNADWEDNKIFKDTLSFTGTSKGRSSIKFHFVGSDETEYEMFLTDFTELALSQSVVEVTGEWAFCKRGSNYGIVKIID